MRKILLFFVLLGFSFLFLNLNISYALTEQQQMLNNQWGNDEDSAYRNENDLTSKTFTINVNDISPGIKSQGSNTSERINWFLGTVIQKMMIALGSLSVLIMTIGAGYMVFHNGQDELLSKGKSIFMAGIYAIIVALSSYLLISIVRYILYSV